MAGATAAFMAAFSLLVGAFTASVAAAPGGQQRDEDEEAYLASDKARMSRPSMVNGENAGASQ
jgi:hypothetical protein